MSAPAAGERRVRVAAAPINWWDDFPLPRRLKPTAVETLEQIRAAGFEGTELGLTLPLLPWPFRRLVRRYGLEPVGTMWPTHLLTRPYLVEEALFRLVLVWLRAMGVSVVMVAEYAFSGNRGFAPVDPSRLPRLSDAQWARLGRGLTRLQRLAERRGFHFGYHPHLGTVVADGEQIDRLIQAAPDLKLAIDTGHLYAAGSDPERVLAQHIGRTVHLHLKNVRLAVAARLRRQPLPWRWAQIEGLFTVPGDGGIDFRPILALIQASGYTGWVVLEAEQDPTKANPYLYSKLGREYLRQAAGW